VPSTHDELRKLQALQRVTDVALGYLPLEELLRELLERIADILGTDTAAFLLLDEADGSLLATAAKGIEEEVEQGVRIPVGRGFAGRIAAERRAIFIEDVDHADILNPILREKGIRSLLGVPLLVEGQVIGVLHVGTLTPRVFVEADSELLQLAADRAATAIERAQLFHQRGVVEVLQRSLVPEELPTVPGLALAARYFPAVRRGGIGGDWYDAFTVGRGGIALVVGDVMGHGIRQAAVMGQMRLGLRAYLLEEHPIDEVVRRTDALLQHLGNMHTATLVLGVVDLTTPALCLANAGHPPPVLVDPAGDAAYVTGGHGRLLGLAEPADRPVHGPAEIAPGTCVLMYTDGLLESHERAGNDGYALLHKTVHGFVGTPDELCDRVTDAMVDDAPSDDICLLAAKVVARPGEG